MFVLSVTNRTVYLTQLMTADYITKEPFAQYCGQSPDWAAPYEFIASFLSALLVIPSHLPLPFSHFSYLSSVFSEVLSGMPYSGVKADIYSLGVLLHLMLTSEYPMNPMLLQSSPPTMSQLKASPRHSPRDQLKIPPPRSEIVISKNITGALGKLVSSMLEIDPEKRPTTREILHHPFLNAGGSMKSFLSELIPWKQKAEKPHKNGAKSSHF